MTYNPYAHPEGLYPGTGAGFTPQPQPTYSKADAYGFPMASKPASPLAMNQSVPSSQFPFPFSGHVNQVQFPIAGQLGYAPKGSGGQRIVSGPGIHQVGGVPAMSSSGYQTATQPWPQPVYHHQGQGQMNPSYVPQRPSAGNDCGGSGAGARTMQVWAYTVFVAAPVGTPLSFSRSLAPLSSDGNVAPVQQSALQGFVPGASHTVGLPAMAVGGGASVPAIVPTESFKVSPVPATVPAVPTSATISSLPPQCPLVVVPAADLPTTTMQIATAFPPPPVQISKTIIPESSVEIDNARILSTSTVQQGGPVDFSFGCKGDYASTYTVTKINQDVQTIRQAMKESSKEGKHTIIATIGHLIPEEMQMLALSYKCTYGIGLSELFHKNVPGRFGKLLHAVSTPPVDYDCACIHEALTRIGVPDEDVLMEILVGRRNAEIHAICETYYRRYGKDLEKQVSHDVSGHVKRLFIALIQGRRDESGQMLDVESDVETLREAGEGKGVDDYQFMSVLATRSDHHLRVVFVEYEGKFGHDIATVVKKAFSGEMERCLLSLVRSVKDRALWAAELFESSMSGLGVRDNMLIRLATRFRHPFVITPIKEAYIRKFGMTLERRIEDATAREYQTLLLLLIAGRDKEKAN